MSWKALLPVAWPFSYWAYAALHDNTAEVAKEPEAQARHAQPPMKVSPFDWVAIQLGSFTKFAIALYAFQSFTPLAAAATLSASWIMPIFVRDLVITWTVAGGWDFSLYSVYSPLYKTMAAYKFNPKYPKASQILHDAAFSTLSTLISSCFEVALLHAWATGRLAAYAGPAEWWTHPATIAWLLTMPFWRIVHFYCVHRVMHHWKIQGIPDVGKWLYTHVHSLHHLSKNPTAWSGVSMHPVESFAYYTAMLIPVLFNAHPLVMLYTKVDLTVAALIGHDGFGSPPGGGSQSHWLHHSRMDVNFGEGYVPLDWFMGTFAASEEDYEAKFGADAKAAKAAAATASSAKAKTSAPAAAASPTAAPASSAAVRRRAH